MEKCGNSCCISWEQGRRHLEENYGVLTASVVIDIMLGSEDGCEGVVKLIEGTLPVKN